jgi:hypothetical protein
MKLIDLGLPGIVHHWFDIAPDTNHPISPAGTRVFEAWEGRGIPVHIHNVQGEPFWSTQEITDCPDLIDQTMHLLEERPDGIL